MFTASDTFRAFEMAKSTLAWGWQDHTADSSHSSLDQLSAITNQSQQMVQDKTCPK